MVLHSLASSEAASVVSLPKPSENDGYESEAEPADRSCASRRAAQTVAQSAQYSGEDGGGTPESPTGEGVPTAPLL